MDDFDQVIECVNAQVLLLRGKIEEQTGRRSWGGFTPEEDEQVFECLAKCIGAFYLEDRQVPIKVRHDLTTSIIGHAGEFAYSWKTKSGQEYEDEHLLQLLGGDGDEDFDIDDDLHSGRDRVEGVNLQENVQKFLGEVFKTVRKKEAVLLGALDLHSSRLGR